MSKVYSSKQIAIFLSLIVVIFSLAAFLKTTGYLSSLIQANLFGLPQTELPFFTEDNIDKFTLRSKVNLSELDGVILDENKKNVEF